MQKITEVYQALSHCHFNHLNLIYVSSLENENRYEGQWKDGMKHGEGKFYHYSKGQVFVGTWLNDIAKCGVMKDFNRETADEATQYPLPEVTFDNIFLKFIFVLII